MRKSGFLLGGWLVVNIAAYRLIVQSGWPMGDEVPEALRVDLIDLLAPWAQVLLMIGAFVIPVVLVPAWLALERAMGIDEAMIAAAWRWCVRTLSTPVSVAVIVSVVVLLALPGFHDAGWLIAIPAFAFLLLMPFGVYTPDVAASSDGERWWKPRWPGMQPLLAILLLCAVAVGIDAGMKATAASFPWFTAIAVIVLVAMEVAVVVLLGSILLFRLTPRETLRRASELLSWRRLGLVLAVHARLLVAALFLVTPVVVGMLVLWKVIPFHAAWAESRGAVLPLAARVFTVAANALQTSVMYMAAFVFGLILSLLVSRLLWMTRAELVQR